MKRICASAFALCCLTTTALASGRVALVIGNSHYDHVAQLINPANDAEAMRNLLLSAGFDDVEFATDLKTAELRRKLSDFELAASKADVAVVYYSGHGLEVAGQNYLVPTDATLRRDVDVEDETVSLDRVLRAVSGAHRLRLVLLDACRSNPFVDPMVRAVPTRAVGVRGLAAVDPDRPDTLVAFAAKAGTVASDGDGSDSPFTTALLHHLTETNVDVRLALGRVRDEVISETRDTPTPQEPFVYGSLGGAELPLVSKPVSASTAVPSQDAALSEAAWQMVQDATTTAPLFNFIDRYPTSLHRSEALKRAAELETLPTSSGHVDSRANSPSAVAPAAGMVAKPVTPTAAVKALAPAPKGGGSSKTAHGPAQHVGSKEVGHFTTPMSSMPGDVSIPVMRRSGAMGCMPIRIGRDRTTARPHKDPHPSWGWGQPGYAQANGWGGGWRGGGGGGSGNGSGSGGSGSSGGGHSSSGGSSGGGSSGGGSSGGGSSGGSSSGGGSSGGSSSWVGAAAVAEAEAGRTGD